MNDDLALLADYSVRGSEAAFEMLVSRYVNLVYSAALRQVQDRQLAEEVTQTAFILLARKAASFGPGTVVPSWLYRTACNAALDAAKKRRRRERREQEAHAFMNDSEEAAWQKIAPVLDAAMARLGEKDRQAILLRYFDDKSMAQVAQALGATEDAAKMRVNRAVEKLRSFFAQRGMAVPAVALGSLLSARAVEAAPAHVALSVFSAAKTASLHGGAATLFKIMTMTKMKVTVIAVAAAAVTAPLVLQYKAEARLRAENESLRQQMEQQTQLAVENEKLSALIAAQTNSQALPPDQLTELLRLRGEVSRLRVQSQDAVALVKAQANNPVSELRQKLSQMPDKVIPELQMLDEKKWAEDASRGSLDTEEGVRKVMASLRRAAKMRAAGTMGMALNSYLKANDGQLPTDLAQLKPYLLRPIDDSILQRYALLHQGKAGDFPSSEPMIGEKEPPVDDQYDTLFKISVDGFTMEGVGQLADPATNKPGL